MTSALKPMDFSLSYKKFLLCDQGFETSLYNK